MIVCISVLSTVISLFSCLILLIWAFSLFFFLMSLANSFSILFIFSKNQLSVLLIFAIVSFISVSFISTLIFMISFLVLVFGEFVLFLVASGVRLSCLFDVPLVSWGSLVLVWTSLLALLLLNHVGFGLLYFHYHLILCIFLFHFWFIQWPLHVFFMFS